MPRTLRATQRPSPDGRTLRSERSRQAIVKALLDLVGEGVLEPTAQQVADRGGVGIRTVFRHFDDMEALFAAMEARIEEDALPLLLAEAAAGSLPERVQALVERRIALYERIAPYKRAGQLKRSRSPFLTKQHETMRRELRRGLLRALPELERAPAGLLDAFDLATSFEAWDQLRTDQRLGRKRAEAAAQRLAMALARDLAS